MPRHKQWTKVRRTRDGGLVKVTKLSRNYRSGGTGCFPHDSPVLTPTGQIPIGQISPNDWVLSWCEATFSLAARRVIKRIDKPSCPIWCLITHDGTRIETTFGHTFLTERGWVRAFRLRRGDVLLGPDGSEATNKMVLEFFYTGRSEVVCNLITAQDSNFVVGGIVAHNFSFCRALRRMLWQIRAARVNYAGYGPSSDWAASRS